MGEKIRDFNEFWAFYVKAHCDPRNRLFHFTGTGLGFICLFIAAFSENPVWLAVGLVVGYGLAWMGHFFGEKNRPATFRYPLWSILADFRMFYLILNGKMNAEVEKYK